VAWVRKINEITDSSLIVERMMEDGYDIIEIPIPGLITVVKEINIPRLASLRGKMKARKANITTITSNDISVDKNRIGLKGSPTQVLRSFVPEKKSGGEKFTGDIPELVEKISSTIRDLNIIK
jgi:electron transfer flavoprotein beta subunit